MDENQLRQLTLQILEESLQNFQLATSEQESQRELELHNEPMTEIDILIKRIFFEQKIIDDNDASVKKLIDWWMTENPTHVYEKYKSYPGGKISPNVVALLKYLMTPCTYFTKDWGKDIASGDLLKTQHESLVAFILTVCCHAFDSHFDMFSVTIVINFISHLIDMCQSISIFEIKTVCLNITKLIFKVIQLNGMTNLRTGNLINKIFIFCYHLQYINDIYPNCSRVLAYCWPTPDLMKELDFITHLNLLSINIHYVNVLLLVDMLALNPEQYQHQISHYHYPSNNLRPFCFEKVICHIMDDSFSSSRYLTFISQIYMYYAFDKYATNLFDSIIVSIMTFINKFKNDSELICDEKQKSFISFDNFPLFRNHFIESLSKMPQSDIDLWKRLFASESMMKETIKSTHSDDDEVDMITSYPLVNGGVTFGGGKVNIDCMIKQFVKQGKDFMNCETSLCRIFYENNHIQLPHFYNTTCLDVARDVACNNKLFDIDWMYKSGMMADRMTKKELLQHIEKCIMTFSRESLIVGAIDDLKDYDNVQIRRYLITKLEDI